MIKPPDNIMTTPLCSSPRLALGLTLIELLIAIVISMVAMIVMLNLFRDTEGSRRITGSTADAQINLQIALASMERDAKNAGVGLANAECKDITYVDATGALVQNADMRRPVVIGAADANGNSSITFTGATSSLSVFRSKMLANGWQRDDPSQIDVENIAGFKRLYDDLASASPSSSPLVMIQQTNHCVIGRMDEVDSANRSFTFKKGGAFGITEANFKTTDYPVDQGLVSVLGDFESYRYFVEDKVLKVQNIMQTGATGDALLRNVIAFRTEYGLDMNRDGVIDNFYAPGASGIDWGKVANDPALVVALRIAIVVQGDQFDKEAKNNGKPVTTSVAWWEGKSDSKKTSYIKALTGDDQYYRYRVLEAVIPLRNAIWSQ